MSNILKRAREDLLAGIEGRRGDGPPEGLHRGLEGVLVDETELSYVDGEAGKLVYRGYDIRDLATEASFEEVLYLLWNGRLPGRDELETFVSGMAAERPLEDHTHEIIRLLAESDEIPMAALRTAVSALSASDPAPDAAPDDREAARRAGRRIAAKMPTILAAYDRRRTGLDPIEPRPDLGHAANFLYMLTGEEPPDVHEEAFDMALILHMDHGLNASTFTTMVVASTYADMYNAITAGIGALSGPWHGGANQDVMETLATIDARDEDAVEWAERTLEAGERIPGFGHRVYRVKDPRAKLLEAKAEELVEETGRTKWFDMVRSIETYLTDEAGLPEKGIAPNVDFYSGTVYEALGIPTDLFTPIFAVSRVGGWVGHVLEYTEDNRLIRPRGRYVGPEDADWVPIDDR